MRHTEFNFKSICKILTTRFGITRAELMRSQALDATAARYILSYILTDREGFTGKQSGGLLGRPDNYCLRRSILLIAGSVDDNPYIGRSARALANEIHREYKAAQKGVAK